METRSEITGRLNAQASIRHMKLTSQCKTTTQLGYGLNTMNPKTSYIISFCLLDYASSVSTPPRSSRSSCSDLPMIFQQPFLRPFIAILFSSSFLRPFAFRLLSTHSLSDLGSRSRSDSWMSNCVQIRNCCNSSNSHGFPTHRKVMLQLQSGNPLDLSLSLSISIQRCKQINKCIYISICLLNMCTVSLQAADTRPPPLHCPDRSGDLPQ